MVIKRPFLPLAGYRRDWYPIKIACPVKILRILLRSFTARTKPTIPVAEININNIGSALFNAEAMNLGKPIRFDVATNSKFFQIWATKKRSAVSFKATVMNRELPTSIGIPLRMNQMP